MKGKILIVDDEKAIRFSLRGILNDEGYRVVEAESGEEGLRLAQEHQPDLVFLDIWLPGMDGMDVLDRLRQTFPDLAVIMISGHGNIETAVQAMQKGAFDFIEKPFSLDASLLAVKKAFDYMTLKRENKDLRRQMREKHVQKLSGTSQPIVELKKMIAQVAPTSAWVLISGENGTGKEIVARSIHAASLRKDMPMVAVNCAAIPEELIESELFGHAKGAFTGADKMKQGRFELADQGTLFLDEIGDMSLKTQAKILRILQEQQFERVGDNERIRVDVRVIAASNKDLESEIEKGNFRADLYYRLKVFPLHVPPLRQRREDIPLLLEEFLTCMVREHNFKPLCFAKDALEFLSHYSCSACSKGSPPLRLRPSSRSVCPWRAGGRRRGSWPRCPLVRCARGRPSWPRSPRWCGSASRPRTRWNHKENEQVAIVCRSGIGIYRRAYAGVQGSYRRCKDSSESYRRR